MSHSLIFLKEILTLNTFCYDDCILKIFGSRDIGQFQKNIFCLKNVEVIFPYNVYMLKIYHLRVIKKLKNRNLNGQKSDFLRSSQSAKSQKRLKTDFRRAHLVDGRDLLF